MRKKNEIGWTPVSSVQSTIHQHTRCSDKDFTDLKISSTHSENYTRKLKTDGTTGHYSESKILNSIKINERTR